MELHEAVRRRKSVRSFRSTPVPDDVLRRVLEAARLAPSARNDQEWRYVIVRDRETIERVSRAAPGQDFIAEAPVLIVCCAETDRRLMSCGHYAYAIDSAISIDHLTLGATAEGLGTCWIGGFDPSAVRPILGIPDSIEVVELLPLGYPTDDSIVEKKRKPIEEIAYYERWKKISGG